MKPTKRMLIGLTLATVTLFIGGTASADDLISSSRHALAPKVPSL